jgi:hypothetical protein
MSSSRVRRRWLAKCAGDFARLVSTECLLLMMSVSKAFARKRAGTMRWCSPHTAWGPSPAVGRRGFSILTLGNR